jgi:hypothetical protein
VAVAWDYEPTERGGFPGYDDARRNMPLPADRNRLAANLILDTARPDVMAGFSADLFIIQANSRVKERDGDADAFYATLREGRPYRGYFAEPFHEIAAIFRALRDGMPVRCGNVLHWPGDSNANSRGRPRARHAVEPSPIMHRPSYGMDAR